MEFNPKCVLVPESRQYPRKVIRDIHYDGMDLVLAIQGPGFQYARVIFRRPVGFRILDVRDLTEFWNTYSEPNGWLWEVTDGGWLALESLRARFPHDFYGERLREFFVVDGKCVSVLCMAPPEIVDIGSSPTSGKML